MPARVPPSAVRTDLDDLLLPEVDASAKPTLRPSSVLWGGELVGTPAGVVRRLTARA